MRLVPMLGWLALAASATAACSSDPAGTTTGGGAASDGGGGDGSGAVSYTHLTLPTIYSV